MTCPVVNVYSANLSVRSITYLENKKIGLIIINKIIILLLLFWFWSANVITFQSFENFINGCTLMTLKKSQLKIYLNSGTLFFSAFYTQLWRCVLYKLRCILHTNLYSTYLFNVLQFFNAMSNKNFWRTVCYLLLQLVYEWDNCVLFQTNHTSKLYFHTI